MNAETFDRIIGETPGADDPVRRVDTNPAGMRDHTGDILQRFWRRSPAERAARGAHHGMEIALVITKSVTKGFWVKPLPSLLIALALALTGCGSGPETSEESAGSRPRQTEAPPAVKAPGKLEFETRTDTITAVHGGEHRNAGAEERDVRVRFMVQIGAFKDPHNASEVQAQARKRYQMPVLNDYYAGLGLYQIRIGFFESRDRAHAFRQRMLREYPAEYGDSWIVQLRR